MLHIFEQIEHNQNKFGQNVYCLSSFQLSNLNKQQKSFFFFFFSVTFF